MLLETEFVVSAMARRRTPLFLREHPDVKSARKQDMITRKVMTDNLGKYTCNAGAKMFKLVLI